MFIIILQDAVIADNKVAFSCIINFKYTHMFMYSKKYNEYHPREIFVLKPSYQKLRMNVCQLLFSKSQILYKNYSSTSVSKVL